MTKATLYLEESIHRALRLKAAETRQSMSELVNDALKASLVEDLEDIDTWQERKGDETVSFEDFVRLLKEDGVL